VRGIAAQRLFVRLILPCGMDVQICMLPRMKQRVDPNAESSSPEQSSVFISHSSKDRTVAVQLCELLEKRNIKCWIAPRDVTAGEPYGGQIVRAIEDSSTLVVVISEHANLSRHVESEVARGFEKGKRIYPVRLADIPPSEGLELFVTSAHWIEAWEHGIENAAREVAKALSAEPVKGAAGVKARARAPAALFGAVFTILIIGFLGYLGFLAFLLREPEEREKYKQKTRVLMERLGWQKPAPPPPTPSPVPPVSGMASNEIAVPASSAPGPDGPPVWRVRNPDLELIWIAELGAYVGRQEITNEQYLYFKKDHWSGLFGGRKLDGAAQPVVRISHAQARAFAEWLTSEERKAGKLPDNWTFRLPTTQEWKDFARCGDDRKYPWGDAWPPGYGNLADRSLAAVQPTARSIDGYRDGYAVSCPVENTATNDWGLQGAAGNVREWTLGALGAECVACGAAWDCYLPSAAECSMAITRDPSTRNGSLGFRIMLAPDAE